MDLSLLIPYQENFDEKVIDTALQKAAEIESEDFQTHFIYTGRYYFWYSTFYQGNRLRSFILEGMKKYNIKSVMVTITYMCRFHLIAKEYMEDRVCRTSVFTQGSGRSNGTVGDLTNGLVL